MRRNTDQRRTALKRRLIATHQLQPLHLAFTTRAYQVTVYRAATGELWYVCDGKRLSFAPLHALNTGFTLGTYHVLCGALPAGAVRVVVTPEPRQPQHRQVADGAYLVVVSRRRRTHIQWIAADERVVAKLVVVPTPWRLGVRGWLESYVPGYPVQRGAFSYSNNPDQRAGI